MDRERRFDRNGGRPAGAATVAVFRVAFERAAQELRATRDATTAQLPAFLPDGRG